MIFIIYGKSRDDGLDKFFQILLILFRCSIPKSFCHKDCCPAIQIGQSEEFIQEIRHLFVLFFISDHQLDNHILKLCAVSAYTSHVIRTEVRKITAKKPHYLQRFSQHIIILSDGRCIRGKMLPCIRQYLLFLAVCPAVLEHDCDRVNVGKHE